MNILIFDTETIGKVSQDILNLGYQIIDLNPATAEFKVLVSHDYLVTDLYNNTVYMINDDFVGAKKYGIYTELLEQKKIIKHTIPQIFKMFANDIAKYQPLFAFAYNANFDIDKITKTCGMLNFENPLQNIPIHDIWAYATHFIVNTDKYKEWASQNSAYTDSGLYLKSSAESVYRFISGNNEYEEWHTALHDVMDETEILCACVRAGCDITKPMKKGANIKSGRVLTETLSVQGEHFEIQYTSKTTRNGITYYKM